MIHIIHGKNGLERSSNFWFHNMGLSAGELICGILRYLLCCYIDSRCYLYGYIVMLNKIHTYDNTTCDKKMAPMTESLSILLPFFHNCYVKQI